MVVMEEEEGGERHGDSVAGFNEALYHACQWAWEGERNEIVVSGWESGEERECGGRVEGERERVMWEREKATSAGSLTATHYRYLPHVYLRKKVIKLFFFFTWLANISLDYYLFLLIDYLMDETRESAN